MSGTLTTKIVFNGINNVSRTIGAIQRSVGGLSKTLTGIGRGARMGGYLSVASVTAPLLAAGKSAFDTTVQFEEAANAFQAVNLKVRDLQGTMSFARQTAIELGKTSFFTPVEIMKGERALAMMGLSGEVAFDKFGKKISEVSAILKDAVNLAAAGQIGIEDSADRLTNATLGFNGKSFKKDAAGNSTGKINLDVFKAQTSEMADVIAAAATSSNTSVSQMLNAMKEAAPIARVLGLDIVELGARLGSMADNGFKGAEAGRAIRTGMLRLISPTNKMQTTLAGLGIPLDKFTTFNDKMLTAQNLINRAQSKGVDMASQGSKISKILGATNLDISQKSLELKEFFKAGLSRADAMKAVKIVDNFITGSIKQVNFKKLIKEVQAKLGKEGSAGFWESVFGKRQVAKFFAETLDPGAVDELQKTIRQKIGNRDGSFAASMAETLMQGLPGALRRLVSSFQAFQVGMIKPIAGEIASAFKGLRGIFDDIIQNTTKLQKKLMIFGAIGVAVIGPLLIYFGLAAMGLGALVRAVAFLLTPLKLLAKIGALLAGSLAAITKGGGLARAALMRFGVIGASIAAAWYGGKAALASFNKALKDNPAASAKASQAMVALRAAARNLGEGKYGDAFSWFKISVQRFKETISASLGPVLSGLKTKIASTFEDIGTVNIDFDGKLDNFYESITNLTGAFAPFGEAWAQFQKDIGASGKGTDQIIWDGIKNIGEGSLAVTIDLITASLNAMTVAVNGVGEASKSAAKGEFTGFLDNIIKIVPNVIKEIAKLGPAMIESVGLKGKVETGTWEEWGNRVSRIINKVGRLLEKVGRKIASILPKSWREKMGIAAPHAKVISEFRDNVIPMIRPVKLSTMPDLPDFAANDNWEDRFNGDTIAGLKGRIEAANIVKAAAELAAKKAEETASAVKSQTSVLERQNGLIAAGNADIVSAIHSNFNSAGHWQGNPASEAVGAPDAPIPISSNGGAGIHP